MYDGVNATARSDRYGRFPTARSDRYEVFLLLGVTVTKFSYCCGGWLDRVAGEDDSYTAEMSEK